MRDENGRTSGRGTPVFDVHEELGQGIIDSKQSPLWRFWFVYVLFNTCCLVYNKMRSEAWGNTEECAVNDSKQLDFVFEIVAKNLNIVI